MQQIDPWWRVLVRKGKETSFPCSNYQKGGEKMKPSNFEKAIQIQFSYMIKRVVDTTVKDYERELGRRAKREQTFSDLSEMELNRFGVTDEYISDFTAFDVFGTVIHVHDEKLCEALKCLSERKRNIVLMFYYLEMSDAEIAELLQVARSTAFRNRTNSLNEIKEMLKKGV